MFNLRTKIQVNKYIFRYSSSVMINRAYDTYTDTAEVIMPNVLYRIQSDNVAVSGDNLRALIKKGDPIKIYAGYNKPDEELPLLFEGFVVTITPGDNLILKCEDWMHSLKYINVPSKEFQTATLSEVVNYCLERTNIKVEFIDKDAALGRWQIDNFNIVTPLAVFEKLKEVYGLYVHFENGVIRVSKTTPTDASSIAKVLVFQYNIIDNGDGLDYNDDSDILQSLKGEMIFEDNSRQDIYIYKENSVLKFANTEPSATIKKTIPFYSYAPETRDAAINRMKDTLTNEFDKYIFTGYSGQIKTFLEPTINPRDRVLLFDVKHKERSGYYKVRSVETEISEGGGWQNIELDYKIQSYDN